jgi:hypothetical protein
VSTKRLNILGLLFCLGLPLCFVSMHSHATPPQWQQAGDDEEDETSVADASVQADFDPKEAAREPATTQVNESNEDSGNAVEKEDTDVEKNDPSKHNEPLRSEEKENLNDAGDIEDNKRILPEEHSKDRGVVIAVPSSIRKTEPPIRTPRTQPPSKQPALSLVSKTPYSFPEAPFVHTRKQEWKTYERIGHTWQLWWLISLLLLIASSFGFAVLHLLFPFRVMRFFGQLSVGFLFFSGLGLLGLLLWRVAVEPQIMIAISFDGLLWFALSSIAIYFWQRREFTQVYISHLLLLPILFGALLWAALLPLSPSATCMQTTVWGWVFGYFTLAGLAVAASWCVASGYLHFFAQRMRGIGYGVPPEHWPAYQQQSARMILLLYPFATLTVFLFCSYSLSHLSSLWTAFGWGDGRAWTFWFAWLLLSAALLSLRLPVALELEGERWEAWHARRLPSFLLLITAFLSALLFVGVPQWIQWLRK